MRLIPRHLLQQIGWITASHVASQIFRLFTNVILARLLAPQIFGVMIIVNTVRTGIELLSDVGIGQNVVSDPDGDQSRFYNTAWTIQIIRGVLLFLVALLLMLPLSYFYEDPRLKYIFLAVSFEFVLSGLASPSRFILQRQRNIPVLAGLDFARAAVTMIVNIVFAFISPTIWALVCGLLVSTALSTAMTFFLIRPLPLKLLLDRPAAHSILHFGKWIFASSVVYFLAMNFDRLYFAKAIPFAVLGVYGVAKTFSDAANALIQRISSLIIFPAIANSDQRGSDLRANLNRKRGRGLILIVCALSFGVAISDIIIVTLYDARYVAAAFMLPVLMLGVWFSILSTMNDAILLGIREPAQTMRANVVKLLWTVIALPIALIQYGMIGAVIVIATMDLVRYVALGFSLHKRNLLFLMQDSVLTLALFALVLFWRFILVAVGLAPGLTVWMGYSAGLGG